MAKKIRVGMILARDFPPDERPEKEALSLIKAGYDVYMLCLTWQGRPLKEDYKGIHLVRFPMRRQLFRKLSPTYLALPFYRWIWQPHIEKFIEQNKIDIIHVHDLPMTDIAHDMAKEYNCKVVCDQHEYWSNWIINTGHYNTLVGKIVKKLSNWKKYEYDNLSRADLVITVTDPLRDCYIQDGCVSSDKIITVPNAPTREIFNKSNVDPEISKRYKNNFVLFYAGAMDILRGLDLVINALAIIEKEVPSIKFVLAGRFSSGFNPLQMAKEAGVDHLVEYVGWLAVEDLPSYMAAADVCLFTPPSTRDEINLTIATKIFQYLAMEKPIITSEAVMMRDFVTENKIGWSVDSQKPEQFAAAVIHLAKNYKKLALEIAENSRKLKKNNKIFWDQTITDMLDAYSKLSKHI